MVSLHTSKKAEAMTLNVIVIAVLVLVVLIVLLLIFTGKITLFNKGVEECPPNSANIKGEDFCVDGNIPLKVIRVKDPTTKVEKMQYCCPKPETSPQLVTQ